MDWFDYVNKDGSVHRSKITRHSPNNNAYLVGDGGFQVAARLNSDMSDDLADRLNRQREVERTAKNFRRFLEKAVEIYAHELAVEENRKREAAEAKRIDDLAAVLRDAHFRNYACWQVVAQAAVDHIKTWDAEVKASDSV